MKKLLSSRTSKVNSLQVVTYIGDSFERYKELIELIVLNETPLAEKAAWAMTHCHDKRVGFFEEFYPEMTKILADESYSDSVKRNIVRVLQFKKIPEEYQASIIDSCFSLLVNKKSAVAVKAFSLGVLENMVKLYPELKNELIACIEDLLPNASSGLKNRGQHILKRLRG